MRIFYSRRFSLSALMILGLIGCLYTCSTDTVQEVKAENLTGEELSRIYCASCHLFPEPTLLPKTYWEAVLPLMANRLGVSPEKYNPYKGKSMEESFRLDTAGIFPKEPLLADTSWQKIVAYYQEHAPDSISLPEPPPGKSTSLFKPTFFELDMTLPIVTMLEVNEKDQLLYYGDANGNLFQLDQHLKPSHQLKLPSPPVDIKNSATPGELLVLNIGLLNPNDIQTGIIVKTNELDLSKRELVFTGLARPVYFESAFLDEDQEEDIIVCHFGYDMGRLSWYKNTGGKYKEHIIKDVPGASKLLLQDIDQDGDQDLIVLFAQGDEGVSIFYNTKGNFKEERLLRLPPIYGSSDMEFLDFDGDGDMDIVLANGDNGDKTYFLKPYHGVRVFLNDGQYQYTERYFFPMYGATKVRARDFDGDGDMDLVASSFFADYEDEGSKSIAYLENKGDYQFDVHYFPAAKDGRWLVMDAGDIDHDGDQDIIFGSFVQGPVAIPPKVLERWRSSKKHVLYLENTLR
ncbi:MAG: VCBS repeat-containing protein [Saprospiraceae bacterium]